MTEACSLAPSLRLRFIGGCEISLLDEPVHLETAKTRALLIYLVANPDPQPRHKLMGLLWAELPEANARRNLRRALWDLRRRLSSPTLPQPILSDRETVHFNQEFPYVLDMDTFEAVGTELSSAPLNPTPNLQMDRARRAAELYRGEFLEGFHVGDAVGFEEWMIAERERLRVMALRVLRYLVTSYAALDEFEAGLHYARRLLALEPWLEEAHGWMMQLLMRSGRRAEALAQYETCKRVLGEELGVEPAEETSELYARIRAGDFEIPSHNLVAATTRFVGRARELGEISTLLADADCRLLTVTGLGGVGKSRLAREVAGRHLTTFAHGVRYIDLGPLSLPDRLAPTLAQSLNIPLIGATDHKTALVDYLRDKQMLVVIDHFEHLLEGAPLLTKLLEAASGVKILVTSRERLNLRGEWVYPLAGMACAPDEYVGDPATFDAARLFVQTAHRVYLGFQIREGESQYLAHVCSLVAGLPLAIELAAAWVRVLSLEQIAIEIARHLDFLATTMRDRPERHRSIRAVFDQSWHLLTEDERDAFERLSVFRDSFRAREATQVSGASVRVLLALVDRSLLQRTLSGSYQLHKLLQQYAREQLERKSGEVEGARNRHCQAYVTLLTGYKQAVRDATHMPILRLIGEDLENVLAAWRWAVEQQQVDAIEAMHAALADYLHLKTSFREGEALFREALEALGWTEIGNNQGPLASMLLCDLATFSVYLGRLSQSRADLEQCLAVFTQHSLQEETAHCQFFLGEIARFVGEYATAQEFFEQSYNGYHHAGNRSAVGFCLNGLGLVFAALGELDRARAYLQDGLSAFKETDHAMGQAIACINLADLMTTAGNHTAAKQILEEGYALCRKVGHRWGMAICLRNLGNLAKLETGNAEAKAAYQASLEILQDIGQRQAAAGCLTKLGEVCTDLGEYAEARHYLKMALSLAAELQDQAQKLDVAASLASLLAKEGHTERALELATLVARHPSETSQAHARAEQLVSELAHQIPGDAYELIRQRSRATTLEDALTAPYRASKVA